MSLKDLGSKEISCLKELHRKTRDGKERDRIKAVILSLKGWSIKQIGEALLLDESTISRHLSEYEESRKLKIESGGSRREYLTRSKAESLITHLETHLYHDQQGIV